MLRRVTDASTVWTQLSETVEAVLTLTKIDKVLWNNSFNYVHSLCLNSPDYLNMKLFSLTKRYIHQHILKLRNEIVSSNEDLLMTYNKNWTKFKKGSEYLNHLYYYFNKSVKKTDLRREDWLKLGFKAEDYVIVEIGKLGVDIWRRTIIEPLNCKLLHRLLDGIRLDRQGVCSNQSVLLGVILSFVEVEDYKEIGKFKFYQDIFETPFLEATSEYYQQESSRLLQENSCSQYMEKVLQLLDEEEFRSRKYLHSGSYHKVRKTCERWLIDDKCDFFLGEFKNLAEEENIPALHNMYILLRSNYNALESLIREFYKHIMTRGFEAINDNNIIAQVFVESIAGIRDKYRSLVETVFSFDHRFARAVDKALKTVVNYKENPNLMCRSPELLVGYCDSMLKNDKACSEDELDKWMNNAIAVFEYLDDKDIFQQFYSKMMARRIIYSQSMSMDAEEAMIEKLKQICGYEFTSKVHRIFTDVGVSTHFTSYFNSIITNNKIKLKLNFSILVFQYGGWPLVKSINSEFAIPQELERAFKEFDFCYRSSFNGRKLMWLHHFSEGELKLRYLKKSYYVRMSTFQMAILLLYRKVKVLSFEDISEMTKLSSEQLSKQMEGLLESKLLLATDSEKPAEPGSSFRLNTEFRNKRRKLRLLPVVQRDAPQQEVRKTHESVVQDRKGVIQAAIVRIMKSRKVLNHNALIQEVINQVKDRFMPDVIMIKKGIENLIEREYIERSADFTDEYNYIA